MQARWKVLLVGVALAAPRCSTAPPCSNHAAPHATFDVASGCAGYYCAMNCEPGFIDCNNDQSDGCETSTTGLPPHTTLDPSPLGGAGCMSGGSPEGTIGSCSIDCEPGFFDCDGDKTNGCETSSAIGCPSKPEGGADGGASPVRIATLSGTPRGLVACAGNDYFIDGSAVREIDGISLFVSTVATSPDTPVDGLTCDGEVLYWSALGGDAAGSGVLYGVPALGGTPAVVASGFDPSPGVDVRDGGVLVMSSGGLLFAQGDGGAGAWMPATPTGAYAPFARAAGDDWSISGGSILRRSDDAGTSAWIDDAGAPTTLVSAGDQPIASIHATFDDAGATSDLLARLVDDAGAATVSPMFATAKPIVASASGAKAVVASDATIYAVTAQQATPVFTTTDHVVDVAIDGQWVIWTTRGEGASTAGVWRGALP